MPTLLFWGKGPKHKVSVSCSKHKCQKFISKNDYQVTHVMSEVKRSKWYLSWLSKKAWNEVPIFQHSACHFGNCECLNSDKKDFNRRRRVEISSWKWRGSNWTWWLDQWRSLLQTISPESSACHWRRTTWKNGIIVILDSLGQVVKNCLVTL